MFGYTVKELQTRRELEVMTEIIWRTRLVPFFPASSITLPFFGYTAEEEARSLAAAKERLWEEHVQSADWRKWIFVQENDSEQIVGAARWDILYGSKFPNGVPRVDLPWWPEGEARKFGEAMLAQANTPRSLWMHRPHGSCSFMAVLPEHRKRGVGGLMMNWGNRKLDELGLEAFVEASILGQHLFEHWGYITVMKVDFFIPSDKTELWARWAHEMKPDAFYAMWRPPYGQVRPGERNRPWQLVPPLPL